MHRPRFGRHFTADWPYDPHDGVGLEFVGAPTARKAFLDVLRAAGCSSPAACRILQLLEEGGTKRTTVRSTLRFDRIGDRLAALGVAMTVIPPAKPTDPPVATCP
ncbi:hypothetical protein WDL1P1_00457 (plasmid) [Variovorax sp. WDL1]|nr:hypothetical protein CHC06_06028 [Variovorax sp. B2]PNG51277.1 hypothetical protein CHC07_05934 [Variovorax sp. B4]VTU43188.1 hypothetical protein SRS16P1_00460 [Variovorax sp. SRS16]VTU43221.1 hypothetical protein E5P1_00457 [Variovorax sp. PBL-E5]VTU43389.1 hypothetical protein H6P1_00446 [Variovorax sp. PBL-H6]VTV17524.1 hypothetical protein WDL1P1_00457 [Variovorax sp. WDL1]